jgi:hypothetical protein
MLVWVPFRERLFDGLVIYGPWDCLVWCGELDGDGYGRLWWEGRRLRVHRVMFEMFVGPIAEGLEPDHLCRIRCCAAPAHLEAVTHRVNMLRGAGFVAENAAKTHCGTCGLPYDEVNTYVTPRGRRDCRNCGRARWRAYYARRKARSIAVAGEAS